MERVSICIKKYLLQAILLGADRHIEPLTGEATGA